MSIHTFDFNAGVCALKIAFVGFGIDLYGFS